jgi:hypothetical protein
MVIELTGALTPFSYLVNDNMLRIEIATTLPSIVISFLVITIFSHC